MTTPLALSPVDSLSLLSLKVAPNVFDVSSGLHHLSIRDQIVRARMLVRDLYNGTEKLDRLLIVGAGVAGMSAALTASEIGVSEVVVVETRSEPFAVFRGITSRYVGPFMYEWPSPFFSDQSYPDERWLGKNCSSFSWKAGSPVSADQLARLLTIELIEKYSAFGVNCPSIYVTVPKWRICEFVKRFARTEATRSILRLQRKIPMPAEKILIQGLQWDAFEASPDFFGPPVGDKVFSPQYVVLAAGMGQEDVTLVPGKSTLAGVPFWSNDDLLGNDTAGRRIAVFGGGDGALQDVLRSLTGFLHPLTFIEHLERKSEVRRALAVVKPKLLSIDRQSRQLNAWTSSKGDFKYVDDHCRAIAGQLAKKIKVVRRVLQALRVPPHPSAPDDEPEVALFVRNTHFDKAYLLNRFLVHLVDACCRASEKKSIRRQPHMRFRIFWQHEAIGGISYCGRHILSLENLRTKAQDRYLADRVVVRYGIEKDSVPGRQMIQISPKPSRQRTTLSRVELPFAVP